MNPTREPKPVPARSDIEEKYTWNAPSLFASPQAWEAAFQDLAQGVDGLRSFQGHLGDSPQALLEAIQALESLFRRSGPVMVYAFIAHQVDMADQAAARMHSQAQGLRGQLASAIAFFDPEILALGRETVDRWLQDEPRLSIYAHYLNDLFRKQAHVRSAEVEQVLGMLADPFAGPAATAGMLTNADFKFPPARTSDGRELEVTQGTLAKILSGADREARRTAWEGYADTYLAHKHTLAASLATSIKQNVFRTRVRHHDSTLEATLFEHAIPVEVFHNLIDTFRQNLPTWHRYWALRRWALGVDTLHPYDIWAPLTADRPHVPYEQAVDWICDGLAPMGEAYVRTLRRGCLQDRWVDVFPNRGKRAGAFSAGQPGTFPFIVMSYNENVFSLSTLAHELGHSMHSFSTWQHQPIVYSDYSLFVAEVASNFHQAMVRAHLLERFSDRAFQISLIEEAMSNFHRYFFIMPTLARFELEVHQRVERGQGVTAEDMMAIVADLFSEGYGGEVAVDRDRVGITWATFGHLYTDYYVYQYATGISGANALSKRILSGEAGAVDAYLRFLQAGSSLYPLDALRLAGVDLTTPHAVEVTFGVLSDLVDRLESLL